MDVEYTMPNDICHPNPGRAVPGQLELTISVQIRAEYLT